MAIGLPLLIGYMGIGGIKKGFPSNGKPFREGNG